jgi:excisionase family DNA binding protein
MVQYYTLEQAAQILRISPEQLKEMARKKEIRAFQDRSGWRFRSQEIDEMARERGYGSDPELPLGEGAKAKAGDSGAGNEVFNFSLSTDESEEVPIGKEPPSSEKKSGSGARKTGSSKTPPKASSDSDVRLVMDGSDVDFVIDVDSKGHGSKPPGSKPPGSKPPASKTPESKGPVSPRPKVGSSKSRLGGPPKDDSGVRIVPLDQPSDSDVKVRPSSPHDSDIPVGEQPTKRPSDSDIRIEEMNEGRRRDHLVTEEIDLDAEQRKADSAAAKAKAKAKAKPKGARPQPKPPGTPPALPTSSPFELSENDINMDKSASSPPSPAAEEAEEETDSSSDFELKPMGDSSPLLDSSEEVPSLRGDLSPLLDSSEEVPVLRAEDEVGLGELTGAKGGSGINLRDPVDSGISLEQQGSDEIEFEMNLDAGSTPKPTTDAAGTDSSSEFELSLSEDDSSPVDEGSSSEFELSLDPEGENLAVDEGSSDLALEAPGSDSDSEFELTLDESGGLSVEEEAAAASAEQDIFETDFEVPALDEESGSEAVALDEADTDLESSEFDLSLESAEESGSQVVPLEDEEESDEGAATVQHRAAAALAEDEEGLEDIGEALDEDLDQEPALEEEEREPAVAAAPAAPAEWGVMPALVMLPCTIILFLVGLMSFELIQGMWGYHRGTKVSNLIIHPIAKMVSGEDKLPDD